jgi:hypothetical protein
MSYSGTIDGPYLMRQYLNLLSYSDIVNGATPPATLSKRNVVTGAQTLTMQQSGSLCLFNSATGYNFKLPVITNENIGAYFDFANTVLNTATACTITTAAATTFIGGGVIVVVDATTPSATVGPKGFIFNGTTHNKVSMGGSDTTTGGLTGTWLRLTALDTTHWGISGTVFASGTIATCATTQ